MQKITTPKNREISFRLITFFKSIASGRERPTTAIINAIAVPSGTPFCAKTWIMGNTPAALLYIGTPKTTATGTAKGFSFVMYFSKKPVGIKPCISAPIPIPMIT